MRLENLVKEKLNVKKVFKVKKTDKDNTYKLTQKLAKVIQKNGNFSEVDTVNALGYVFPLMKKNNIKVLSVKKSDLTEKINQRIGRCYEDANLYDVLYWDISESQTKTGLLVVTSNDKGKNGVNGFYFSRYREDETHKEWGVVSSKTLNGYYQLFKAIDKEIAPSDKYEELKGWLFLGSNSRYWRMGGLGSARTQMYRLEQLAEKTNLKEFETKIEDIFDDLIQVQYERTMAKLSKATPYMTKKNINLETQKAMEETKLNNDFKYIELDNTVDLKKFKLAEKDMLKLNQKLPKGKKQAELRIRKLGNYKANGVFFPNYNCIAVDFREGGGLSSYVHEYGHYLDYNFSDTLLSRTDKFKEIVRKYSAILEKKNFSGYSSKYDLAYFTTPTEVFARGFELFVNNKGYEGSFVKTEQEYNNQLEYSAFNEIKSEVLEYFNNEFKLEF